MEYSTLQPRQGINENGVIKENQERLSQDTAQLFAADKPRPGFRKVSTDFQQVQTVNKGQGRLEKRRSQTGAMRNDSRDWPGLGQVYRLERCFTWIRQGKVIKTRQEVEDGITSLSREKASPKRGIQVRRKHWRIAYGHGSAVPSPWTNSSQDP